MKYIAIALFLLLQGHVFKTAFYGELLEAPIKELFEGCDVELLEEPEVSKVYKKKSLSQLGGDDLKDQDPIELTAEQRHFLTLTNLELYYQMRVKKQQDIERQNLKLEKRHSFIKKLPFLDNKKRKDLIFLAKDVLWNIGEFMTEPGEDALWNIWNSCVAAGQKDLFTREKLIPDLVKLKNYSYQDSLDKYLSFYHRIRRKQFPLDYLMCFKSNVAFHIAPSLHFAFKEEDYTTCKDTELGRAALFLKKKVLELDKSTRYVDRKKKYGILVCRGQILLYSKHPFPARKNGDLEVLCKSPIYMKEFEDIRNKL